MRAGEERIPSLDAGLKSFKLCPLPGLSTDTRRASLVTQFVDSIRRIEYVHRLRTTTIDPDRCDPTNDLFDPIRAAVLKHKDGNLDEAFWLVFLATHCGRHLDDHWRLARTLYGSNGTGPCWNWSTISGTPDGFHDWLVNAYTSLRSDGVLRRFGNHRKYETLLPGSARGTSAVFRSYIAWVGANRGHGLLIQEAQDACGGDPRATFDYLYNSMGAVTSFGRTGRFDFLTMVGKVGLANIEPGIPYLVGATGPLRGARLAFGGSYDANLTAQKLDRWVTRLGDHLGLGMQAMEDALCNWQKSPDKYLPFRG
ncbi:MAG TPA: hypothetical protein VL574_13995 [Stellaceae bacterium]|jgi:hypothetical protein|nr:hypothetical protein [Stellaceae bacterium]